MFEAVGGRHPSCLVVRCPQVMAVTGSNEGRPRPKRFFLLFSSSPFLDSPELSPKQMQTLLLSYDFRPPSLKIQDSNTPHFFLKENLLLTSFLHFPLPCFANLNAPTELFIFLSSFFPRLSHNMVKMRIDNKPTPLYDVELNLLLLKEINIICVSQHRTKRC